MSIERDNIHQQQVESSCPTLKYFLLFITITPSKLTFGHQSRHTTKASDQFVADKSERP
jgi:hypothetical protein